MNIDPELVAPKVDSDLLRAEEAKRDRNLSPQQRWHVILQTIAWAEAQQTPRRNSKGACLANQARILNSMAEAAAKTPPVSDALPRS